MTNIDFLPSKYHEQRRRRNSSMIVGAVAASTLLLLAITAVAQLGIKAGVDYQVAALEADYNSAMEVFTLNQSLTKESNQLDEKARLITYLDHPWPHSRMLADLALNVPESMTISNCTFSYAAGSEDRTRTVTLGQPKKEADDLSPTADDLKAMRATRDEKTLVIRLEGTTTSAAETHVFLAKIPELPLFQSANLESSESSTDAKNSVTSFSLAIRVNAAYAQPGGPDTKTSLDSNDNSSASPNLGLALGGLTP